MSYYDNELILLAAQRGDLKVEHIQEMDEMIQIYNRTEQICFDDKKIYLLPKKLAV